MADKSLSDRALRALEAAVEALDYAGNVSRSGIAGAVDRDGSAMDWMDEAARGKRHTSGGLLKDTTTKRLLGDGHMRMGVDGDGKTSMGDVGDVALDTAIEVLTDPLTLLGGGLLKSGKLGKVFHAGEAGMAGPKGGKNVLKEALELVGRGVGNVPDDPMLLKDGMRVVKAGPGEMLDLGGNVIKDTVAPLKVAKKAVVDAPKAVKKGGKRVASSKSDDALAALESKFQMADEFQGFAEPPVLEKALGSVDVGLEKPVESSNFLVDLLKNNPKSSILTGLGLGTGASFQYAKPTTDGFRTSPRKPVKASVGDGGKTMPKIDPETIKIVKKLSPGLLKQLEQMGAYNKDDPAATEAAMKKVEPFIRKWSSL